LGFIDSLESNAAWVCGTVGDELDGSPQDS